MGSPNLVFEVHYGGRFDRHFGCEYVGGEVAVHHESYDPENLSYFELEGISKPYGCKSKDLMYFRNPKKSLVDGLHLITSDHDVLFLSPCHIGHFIVHFYIISFGEWGGNEEEEDDRGRVDLRNPWWADKLSDNEDLFDVDEDEGGGGGGVGPCTRNRGR
jgi:hypothetical protein